MKTVQTIIFLILIISSSIGQEKGIPDWYIQDISSEVGVWIADNSEYKSENEPYDAYAIEWKWSPMKNSIYGRLYGLADGKDMGSFWNYHKYWDPAQDKVIVMQTGWDGTLGTGFLRRTGDQTSELIQVFTNPDGSQRKEAHRTRHTSDMEETGTSFSIDENGEWISRRTYTWKKQAAQAEFDKELAQKLGADDYGMSQYVFVFLKSGPNRSPDEKSAAELQSAHLNNIIRLANEGLLALAGPFLDGGDYRGIFVLNVKTVDEARKLVNSDPMIKAGVLEAEFIPWYGSAALKMVTELHGKVAVKSIP